ncbi:hypothetical protein GCM10022403_097720 [Streptomyces coacervatus]|uniref:Uncharacterized protein n=1 Tax=Streptomyces coacervatus TaxID=647381 RepID=A0ABP7JPM3_9ACTN
MRVRRGRFAPQFALHQSAPAHVPLPSSRCHTVPLKGATTGKRDELRQTGVAQGDPLDPVRACERGNAPRTPGAYFSTSVASFASTAS